MDTTELISWAVATFDKGTYLGDLAREARVDGNGANMAEEEEMNLICAREGYLARDVPRDVVQPKECRACGELRETIDVSGLCISCRVIREGLRDVSR